MLVLSRKPGESIKLGEEIEVVIVAVEGQRVRIGIKAPREVRILRTEIDPKIVQSNQDAAVKQDAIPADLLRQAAEARARKGTEPK
ncbi:MAG TPA: carbon storage regulator CsrA [Candidatus Methylacidiphilales bacterium]